MDKKVLHLFILGLTFSLVLSEECPKECLCHAHGYVDCMNQNITNERLAEIAKQLKPKEVVSLSLEKNKITDFQAENFLNFIKLEGLYLQQNALIKVPVNISYFIPSFTLLNLGNNRISAIEQKDFEGYHSITSLNIEENGIESLEPNLF